MTLSIAALHRAFRAGEILPSLRLAATWEAIAASRLNAFADLDHHGADAAAAASDRRVRAGDLRPLEGVMVGIKSNLAVTGLPWTAGMATRRDIVAVADAAVVGHLRDAGAIILGTVGMHEAALGATSDNPWFGRIENAVRPGRTPGGSSGGSGAAVAAGLCDVALGTDTLGSIRIPAAYNGVYGLKPTHGALANDGLVALAPDLDAIGPLGRSLDDLAAVWAVLAPMAPRGQTPRRLIVLDEIGEVEPAVAHAYAAALAAMDLPLTTLRLADPLAAIRRAGLIAAGRALIAALGETRRTHAAELSPDLHHILDFCSHAEPRPEVLARTFTAVSEAVGEDGVLLLPTTPQAAFAHGPTPVSQAEFTALANIAGLPALSLPAGLDADGLPVAVQLVGPVHAEAMLLKLTVRLAASLPPSSAVSDR